METESVKQENPWDQRDEEPMLWFSRFEKYRLLGTNRTLIGFYRSWREQNSQSKLKVAPKRPLGAVVRDVPSSWDAAYKKWEWKARAEAWDKYEIQRNRADYEEDRVADRKHRLDILRAARSKLVQALSMLDPNQARWGDVTSGLKLINTEIRSEYDDMPQQRVAMTGADGKNLRIEVVFEERDIDPRRQKDE